MTDLFSIWAIKMVHRLSLFSRFVKSVGSGLSAIFGVSILAVLAALVALFFRTATRSWISLDSSVDYKITTAGFLAALIAYTAISFDEIIVGLLSYTWSHVSGVVIKSDLITYESDEGPTTYEATIVYQYEVGESTYQRSRISVGGRSRSSRLDAEYDACVYPVNATVRVYVSPWDPECSILERGVPANLPLRCIVLIGLSALCISVII